MRVLIVDDEAPARERLRELLNRLPDHEPCGEASHGAEALRLSAQLHPDIVLLDIQMPGLDGLETARRLSALEQPPAIIFTTAHGDYALDAFDTHAVAYLLKPIRLERLEQALASAKAMFESGGALRDVLDARRMWLEGKLMYVRAVAEQYEMLSELILCCGLGDLEALQMIGATSESETETKQP